MRPAVRRRLLTVTAALLVALPAAPAAAGEPYHYPHCPGGVADVRSSYSMQLDSIDTLLANAAARHGIPAAVLKAVSWRASGWKQFLPDAHVGYGTDETCPIGLLRVPAAGRERADAVKLASDVHYNADQGALRLRAMWDGTQQALPPLGYAADDPDVLENWWDAICHYGGCTAADTSYARDVARTMGDPFVWVPQAMKGFLRPAGFTAPGDAEASYAYPQAFQARDGELVLYDAETGVVSKVVAARTHRASAPPSTRYPGRASGPDGRGVTCGGCAGWRRADGVGLAGRARWTTTVTGAPTTSIRWRALYAGNSRVQVYVPALGATPLGTVTYRVDPQDGSGRTYAVTVDQNARKGTWVTLGDWFMSSESTVSLDNRTAVAGRTIVADSVRMLWTPVIVITGYRKAVGGGYYDAGELTYGQPAYLKLQFNDGAYDALPGQRLKVYQRPLGATAWQMIGTWTTDANAEIELAVKPRAGVDFVAKWVTTDPEVHTDGTSRTHRFTVRQLATMEIPDNVLRPGESVVAHAKVTPAHAGQTVYLQRFYSGAWRNVQARALSTYGTATFRYSFAAPEWSVHNFRVHKPADRDHLFAVSPDYRSVMVEE